MADWFGSYVLFSADGLLALAGRLALDLAFALIVIKVVYARLYHRRDYVFTYVLFNIITFALCFLLRRVPIELGFALGLFAVFGILRYRTEAIRLRDLTYLFVVIGIAILNAVASETISLSELLAVNVLIAGAVYVLEMPVGGERLEERTMTYDKLDLLRPENEAALHSDIETRTGLRVSRVAVDNVDLVRDTANLTVYFRRPKA